MNIPQITQEFERLLQLTEAKSTAIGEELTKELIDELVQKYPQKLKPIANLDNQTKISWLINYVDVMDKTDLIGIKISNIASIQYSIDGKLLTNSITLMVGDTEDNSSKLLPFNQLSSGLYHMRYGDNKHWTESKEALHLIPRSLDHGVVRPGKEKYKLEVYFRKRNCIYVVGVPSPMGDATILVTCQRRNNKRKPR